MTVLFNYRPSGMQVFRFNFCCMLTLSIFQATRSILPHNSYIYCGIHTILHTSSKICLNFGVAIWLLLTIVYIKICLFCCLICLPTYWCLHVRENGMQYTYYAANERCRLNDGLMLAHCLRRLLNADLNLELDHIACLLRPCRRLVSYSVNPKHEACKPQHWVNVGETSYTVAKQLTNID